MYAEGYTLHKFVTNHQVERISGLHTLLEEAPPLPASKLSWHIALEKLLDSTRAGQVLILHDVDDGLKPAAELSTRIEGLKAIEKRMQDMRLSIAMVVSGRTLVMSHDAHALHQEMYSHDLNLEFANLHLTDSVNSAQAATASSYKDWRDNYTAVATIQRRLSTLFSSGRSGREILENENSRGAREASENYHKQGELID